jgi:ferredoxin--NADP+ reductase
MHRVVHVRDVSSSAFVLRFSREGLAFHAGQWINLGLPRSRDQREYSVYSSPSDDFLEVLVKEIPEGKVSRALRRCRPGDSLQVDGPHGSFTLVEGRPDSTSYLFVATGTGVSPFHCFVRSRPHLDYLLLHGVRSASELYDRDSFAPARFFPCLSRESGEGGAHAGRVTTFLAERPLQTSTYCYLCGNSDMIYEAYALLRNRGIPHSRIFAEVYF